MQIELSYKQKIFSDLVPKREHDVSISYKLRVQRNQAPNNQWVEQDLTETVNQGLTRERPSLFSIPVNDAIKKMFDEAPIGGDFDIRIIAKYDYPDFPIYEKSYPPTPIVFVPKLYWAFPGP